MGYDRVHHIDGNGSYQYRMPHYLAAMARTSKSLLAEVLGRLDGDLNPSERQAYRRMSKADLAAIIADWATASADNEAYLSERSADPAWRLSVPSPVEPHEVKQSTVLGYIFQGSEGPAVSGVFSMARTLIRENGHQPAYRWLEQLKEAFNAEWESAYEMIDPAALDEPDELRRMRSGLFEGASNPVPEFDREDEPTWNEAIKAWDPDTDGQGWAGLNKAADRLAQANADGVQS